MTDAAIIGRVTAPEVHVMSFNIRRRLPSARRGSPDRWSTRRPLVTRLLAAEQPTILGVQEALADQVHVIAEGLGPAYRWVGMGRDPSGRGERCPVFYDADRLELIAWRQRALSATPDLLGSRTRSWGNLTRRILVSAAFADRSTGARIVAFNTHLDHLSWRSRLHSARFIVELASASQAADPDAAVVVTGDFNANERSAVYRALTADGVLRDSWDAAAERITPQWGTYHGYRRLRRGGPRIDFVFAGRGVDVARVAINAARFDGLAASDHEPVQAVVRPPAAGDDQHEEG
ncbi:MULTISPECIES: endonuclease/exonuclease/phosphatase family protein [unclassified Agromyces]|uniref:endonuclease/exonuclease/phosphatase family protein n=1 Tax=unclassified Agromyces TaxID=2639701 RepID=UPI0030143872